MSRFRSLSTLLIATRTDPASVNIARCVLSSFRWEHIASDATEETETYRALSTHGSHLYLWFINQPLLTLNRANELFCSSWPDSMGELRPPQDILFLSRHAAASGTLSLTVHPVGIPWLSDNVHVGGVPGRCSPPSFRIASLYREVLQESKRRGLSEKFEVTLEATHHGPFVEVPACFVEIGSNESEWSNPDAGSLWASILGAHLQLRGLDDQTDSQAPEEGHAESVAALSGVVVVTIGGGHYVPKMNDVARFGAKLYTGHALTSYSIKPYLDGSIESPVEGGWRGIIDEAIASTRIAFPVADLVCLIDKGAFNAEQRNLIGGYLDDLGVKNTVKSADIKKLWESHA